jgi:xanthine dehydrogenase YagT iron-sulfur-binding subunit
MSAIALIAEKPVDREAIRDAMSGNLCRCGAYPNIVEAIAEVAGL